MKSIINYFFVAGVIISLSSCGVFKKKCDCPHFSMPDVGLFDAFAW